MAEIKGIDAALRSSQAYAELESVEFPLAQELYGVKGNATTLQTQPRPSEANSLFGYNIKNLPGALYPDFGKDLGSACLPGHVIAGVGTLKAEIAKLDAQTCSNDEEEAEKADLAAFLREAIAENSESDFAHGQIRRIQGG